MTRPANQGNFITRRAFSQRDGVDLPDARMKALRRIVNKAMSTAYQMTEEVGEYGSGTPSPLHMLCELIREAREMDAAEGLEVSTAQELAEYPLTFLRQLRGEVDAGGDFVCKINCMMKAAAQAGYLLKGRELKDLSPAQLKDIAQQLMTAQTLAGEMLHMVTEAERMFVFPGAPLQGERQFRRTGTDD